MSGDEDQLEDSRQFWSQQYGKELTIDDVKEINNNLLNFFQKLYEMDLKNKNEQ